MLPAKIMKRGALFSNIKGFFLDELDLVSTQGRARIAQDSQSQFFLGQNMPLEIQP